jgi:hypothetical protein
MYSPQRGGGEKKFQKYEHLNLRCFPKKCPLKLRSDAPDAVPGDWRPLREEPLSAGPAADALYAELLSQAFRG